MDGISIVVSSLQISTESTMGASLCFDIETKLVVMCNLPIPLHFWAKQTDQVSWIIIALKNPAIRRQCGSQSSNLHIVVQILALHQFKSINFQPPPPPQIQYSIYLCLQTRHVVYVHLISTAYHWDSWWCSSSDSYFFTLFPFISMRKTWWTTMLLCWSWRPWNGYVSDMNELTSCWRKVQCAGWNETTQLYFFKTLERFVQIGAFKKNLSCLIARCGQQMCTCPLLPSMGIRMAMIAAHSPCASHSLSSRWDGRTLLLGW